MSEVVRIAYYVRTAVEGGYRYDKSDESHPTGRQLARHAPAVGDLVYVPRVGGCVVLARSWTYAAWGSTNWPYTASEPIEGPMLDLIVEVQAGPFVDEVYDESDDAGPVEETP